MLEHHGYWEHTVLLPPGSTLTLLADGLAELIDDQPAIDDNAVLVVRLTGDAGVGRSGQSGAGQSPATDDVAGRGLAIVAQLADRWGVEPSARGTGKTVWLELSTRSGHTGPAA